MTVEITPEDEDAKVMIEKNFLIYCYIDFMKC